MRDTSQDFGTKAGMPCVSALLQNRAVAGVDDAAVAVWRLAAAFALGQIALVVLASHVYSLHAHGSADCFTGFGRPQFQKS